VEELKRRHTDGLAGALKRLGPFATVAVAGGVFAFRLGAAVNENTHTLRVLATHVCRIEEKQHFASFEDCIFDFTTDSRVQLKGGR
jgi:hypothetical protein